MYFTSLYVTLRILREVVNCTLPIEVRSYRQGPAALTVPAWPQVFYVGAAELPADIVAYLETHFANTRFVDVTTLPEAAGLGLRGYQLKAFALLLSSFEEVGGVGGRRGGGLTRQPRIGLVARLGQHAAAGPGGPL
jgi:hypothetical protein